MTSRKGDPDLFNTPRDPNPYLTPPPSGPAPGSATFPFSYFKSGHYHLHRGRTTRISDFPDLLESCSRGVAGRARRRPRVTSRGPETLFDQPSPLPGVSGAAPGAPGSGGNAFRPSQEPPGDALHWRDLAGSSCPRWKNSGLGRSAALGRNHSCLGAEGTPPPGRQGGGFVRPAGFARSGRRRRVAGRRSASRDEAAPRCVRRGSSADAKPAFRRFPARKPAPGRFRPPTQPRVPPASAGPLADSAGVPAESCGPDYTCFFRRGRPCPLLPRAKAPGRKGLYGYTCISPLRAAARLRRLGRGEQGGGENTFVLSLFGPPSLFGLTWGGGTARRL